jgi:hypothetical protein
MSLILEKTKRIQQKIKNLENLKKNFNKPHNKLNQNKHSRLNNSNPPRQKSYAINEILSRVQTAMNLSPTLMLTEESPL